MTVSAIRIIGIDPGLRNLGWGVIECVGSRLSFVACGSLHSDARATLGERLGQLHRSLTAVIETHRPHEAAVEETFVNRDPQTALKLGQARGIAMVVPALAGIAVAEYAANLIKKTVVGAGHAEKAQIALMVRTLLPQCGAPTADAADALATAITHAQHRVARQRMAAVSDVSGRRTGG